MATGMDEQDSDSAAMRMLHRVASSEAVVRSQQRDEPDLTEEQKVEQLSVLLSKSHVNFLARFGEYLKEEDLVCFDGDDVEQAFYLKEIRKNFDPAYVRRVARNRRTECMYRLVLDGEYFSERAMSMRNPLLFEQYIGQFMSDEERKAMELEKEEGQCALSEMILFQMQQSRRSRLLAKQKEQQREEEVICGMEDLTLPQNQPHPSQSSRPDMVGDVSDADEDNAEQVQATQWGELPKDKSEKEQEKESGPSAEDRALLRSEFISAMQQSFLEGKDKDFDYSAVDKNADFDNLETRRRDEEDAYFEAEDPADCLADDEDLAWLRSMAAKRHQQPPPEFEEEFEEDDDDDDEDEAMDGT